MHIPRFSGVGAARDRHGDGGRKARQIQLWNLPSTLEYPGVPWSTPEYPGVPWSTLEYPGVPVEYFETAGGRLAA